MRSHLFRAVYLPLAAFAAVTSFGAAFCGEVPKPTLKAVAGGYYQGDGLGANVYLNLTEDGRFTFKWRGCLGVYAENEGTAQLVDGSLVLAPSKPNDRDGFGMDTEFVPIFWGKSKQRVYLIPKGEGKGFCNSINFGKEPRHRVHGRHYLRVDDWKVKVDGAPDMPKEWAGWLLTKPIKGAIVQVNPDRTGKVNLGARDGVWVGMNLYVDEANGEFVVVKSVETDSCIVGHKHDNLDANLKQGSKVASKLYYNGL